MRKIIGITSAALAAFALAGCGPNQAASPAASTTAASTTTSAPTTAPNTYTAESFTFPHPVTQGTSAEELAATQMLKDPTQNDNWYGPEEYEGHAPSIILYAACQFNQHTDPYQGLAPGYDTYTSDHSTDRFECNIAFDVGIVNGVAVLPVQAYSFFIGAQGTGIDDANCRIGKTCHSYHYMVRE